MLLHGVVGVGRTLTPSSTLSHNTDLGSLFHFSALLVEDVEQEGKEEATGVPCSGESGGEGHREENQKEEEEEEEGGSERAQASWAGGRSRSQRTVR